MSDEDSILKEARERFADIKDRDQFNRDQQREDIAFVYVPGKQWPDAVRSRREGWKEPCLEFNQLKQFVSQVVNDQRRGRPSVRIHPASGDASDEVAEILQGMIRGIEYQSRAETAYDNGFQSAVVGGRGYWRIVSEYEDGDGFEQSLRIKPILDPLTVYLDDECQEPDGSDRNWAFVTETLKEKEFKRLYPDCEPISWDDDNVQWRESKDSITIADYYRRVCEKRVRVRMSDGAEGWEDEMPAPPDGITPVARRECETYRIEWYKIAGGQKVLAKYEWPGTIIPVVCVTGDDVVVDGQRVYQGLVRHARDAQRMFNFGLTQQAVHLALTPRAPWVVAEGQIEGYENLWRNANTENYSALVYKPTSVDGHMVPMPQRQNPSAPDAGWMAWGQQMTGMIRSTIGMYEASLGMRGDAKSGIALRTQEEQGETVTYHFLDNLSRAISLTGRILVELIPHYYDTERIVHTVEPDDTRKLVRINGQAQMLGDDAGALQAIRENDVTVGKYAVTVEAGPGFATKRQETSDKLMQLVQAFPPVAQVAGDLVVKSLDVADADLLAERLKFALPPEIRAAEAQKAQEGGKPMPPEVQAVLQATQAKEQQLQAAATEIQQAAAQIQGEAAQLDAKKSELSVLLEKIKSEADALAAQRKIAEQAVRLEGAAVEMEAVKLEAEKSRLEAEAAKRVQEIMTAGTEQNAGSAAVAAEALSQNAVALAAIVEQLASLKDMADATMTAAKAAAAPRESKLLTDSAGNPIGAVSVPVLEG